METNGLRASGAAKARDGDDYEKHHKSRFRFETCGTRWIVPFQSTFDSGAARIRCRRTFFEMFFDLISPFHPSSPPPASFCKSLYSSSPKIHHGPRGSYARSPYFYHPHSIAVYTLIISLSFSRHFFRHPRTACCRLS